jgi:hypothetical protein
VTRQPGPRCALAPELPLESVMAELNALVGLRQVKVGVAQYFVLICGRTVGALFYLLRQNRVVEEATSALPARWRL